MKKKRKIKRNRTVFCSLMFFALLFLTGSRVCAAEDSTKEGATDEPGSLYALSACLMDADSGRILYEKDGATKRANASTTKILTLIVTLEQANLDDIVTISEYAAKQPDVQLNVCTGEQYVLRDLCYSMMLESHNDAAVAIAEHVGGSVEGFSQKMNEKAGEIGCKNSYFITPNGLDAEDEKDSHGTTADDLARILSYCITKSPKKEAFLEITRTPAHSFCDVSGKRSFSCNNHNAFLNMMACALCGKTGFTGDAGYCYVGAVRQEERTFVVALLGCGWPNNKSYKWSDMKTLVNFALENYHYETVGTEAVKLPELIVRHAADDTFAEIADQKQELSYEKTELKVLKADWEKITLKTECPAWVEAPVAAKKRVGAIRYYLEDKKIAELPVYTTTEIGRRNQKWYANFVWKKFSL